MNEDRFEELAALDALDLLEGADKAEFEGMLERNPTLRDQARDLREAGAALAYAAPPATPPEALKARILASIKSGAPGSSRSHLISFPILIPWAVAACFALVAAGMGIFGLMARSENRLLREQKGLAEVNLHSEQIQLQAERIVDHREIADARGQAAEARRRLADSEHMIADLNQKLESQNDLAKLKIATLASMLGNSPQALAVAVWDPSRQQGVLSVAKLPVLAKGQDYQLWVIDPHYPGPVNGGVFTVDPANGDAHLTFKADKPIRAAVKFAISRERAGGVPEPQGPIVLLSQ
jgi:anti-sigma-K factor RskA